MSEALKAQNPSARIECPSCGKSEIQTRYVAEKFKYGSPEKSVELEALVPHRKCSACQFEFTDDAAEDAVHEAICSHLRRMIPSAVAGVRKRYDMNRDEFAAATDIGAASLGRWESGQLIQNAAYDNYLYLLTFPENMQRLATRWQKSALTPEVQTETKEFVRVAERQDNVVMFDRTRIRHRFRTFESENVPVVQEANGFSLARRPRARRCT